MTLPVVNNCRYAVFASCGAGKADILQVRPDLEVIKHFSCSTQLSIKLKMLISIKISRNSAFSGSDKPRMLFLLLINVKMPTVIGILIFLTRKNFMLS